jgi:hypothetical protein
MGDDIYRSGVVRGGLKLKKSASLPTKGGVKKRCVAVCCSFGKRQRKPGGRIRGGGNALRGNTIDPRLTAAPEMGPER